MAAEAKDKFGRLCKERMIEEILERFKRQPNFVITSFMGSTVSDMELLRRNLKKSSANYVVVKNSMLKIIFDRIKVKDAASEIEGGMGISLSGEDIISTCKALVVFAKNHGKFKIKSAYFDGRAAPVERVNQLAAFSSGKALMTHVVIGIKAPITGFVNTLGGVLRKFVCVVGAIKTSKEKVVSSS